MATEDDPDLALADNVELARGADLRSDTSGVAFVEEKAENLDDGAAGSSSLICRLGRRAASEPRTLPSSRCRGDAAMLSAGFSLGGGVRPESEGNEDIESSKRAVSSTSSSVPKMGECNDESKLGSVGNGGCDWADRVTSLPWLVVLPADGRAFGGPMSDVEGDVAAVKMPFEVLLLGVIPDTGVGFELDVDDDRESDVLVAARCCCCCCCCWLELEKERKELVAGLALRSNVSPRRLEGATEAYEASLDVGSFDDEDAADADGFLPLAYRSSLLDFPAAERLVMLCRAARGCDAVPAELLAAAVDSRADGVEVGDDTLLDEALPRVDRRGLSGAPPCPGDDGLGRRGDCEMVAMLREPRQHYEVKRPGVRGDACTSSLLLLLMMAAVQCPKCRAREVVGVGMVLR